MMGKVASGQVTPAWVRRQVTENQEGFLVKVASH